MSLIKNNESPSMNHRIYDKNAEPLFVINSGETVAFDTNDAWSGVFKESCIATPQQVEDTNRLMAPATGPIVVKNAKPGDWLKVTVNKLEPAAAGVAAIGDTVCMLQNRFGPFQARVAELKDGFVVLNDRIKIPIRPMIGTIGTTPAVEAPKIRFEGIWGGNLDVPTLGQGTEVWLPVFIAGAYLYVGDCHAIQGDGELLNPFELSAHIELRVELISDKSSAKKWPRLVNEDAIETIGVGNTFEKAVEIALGQMIDWLMEDYGFSQDDAAFFCGSVVNGRPGAIVNDKVSARCVIEKKYLPEKI